MRVLQYRITEDYPKLTIEKYLRSLGYSHHIMVGLKQNHQGILLNGDRSYANVIPSVGDCITVNLQENSPSENIVAVRMELDILHEDEDILVLNKPADVPIHPSMGNFHNTLANGVAYYYKEKGEPFCYRCINRLDRDTTGALIMAKNSLSAAVLSAQMAHRQIKRRYLAVVEGDVEASGTVDAPIAREDTSVIIRCVDYENGEHAITHYVPIKHTEGYTLLELYLDTGRTHQIRVHMKHVGHPLPGDYLYNPNYEDYSRQPLHSWKLDFRHPITGEPLSFVAPVPEDMKKAF